VLLAKDETKLEGMPDRLVEFGTHYGMEINVNKLK
jgi:hypothetical protein